MSTSNPPTKLSYTFRRTNQERVTRGALWLDAVDPMWFETVDPDKLDLGSGCNCVIGQLVSDVKPTLQFSSVVCGYDTDAVYTVNRLVEERRADLTVPELRGLVMSVFDAIQRGFEVDTKRNLGGYGCAEIDYKDMQERWVTEIMTRREARAESLRIEAEELARLEDMRRIVNPIHVSKDDVVAELRKLRGSGNKNPREEHGRCAYQKDNADGTISHCIAGEVLTNLGGVVPKDPDGRYINGGVQSISLGRWGLDVDGDAIHVLSRAQSEADGVGYGEEKPWSDVVKLLEKEGTIVRPQVTKDDVIDQMLLLLQTKPNQRNPRGNRGGGACLYQKDNEDGTTEHCIAGQILVNLGGTVPKTVDGHYVNGPVRGITFSSDWGVDVTDAALTLLTEAQRAADKGYMWFNVIRDLITSGELRN